MKAEPTRSQALKAEDGFICNVKIKIFKSTEIIQK